MKPESKQTRRNNTDESSASCYDFTKLSEALESTEDGTVACVIPSGDDSLVATTVQSDGKSPYDFKEIAKALNLVEKNCNRRLKARKRKLKRMRQKQRKAQAFEDLDKHDPNTHRFCPELYTVLSVLY
ncbi:hypothetical protein SLE2022_178090 [Rubroshorea leprosula]